MSVARTNFIINIATGAMRLSANPSLTATEYAWPIEVTYNVPPARVLQLIPITVPVSAPPVVVVPPPQPLFDTLTDKLGDPITDKAGDPITE